MANITYLRLDAENDPIFNSAASLSDLAAVAQAIETRVKLFQGEWWENLNEGTPMFQDILGSSGSAKNQTTMSLILTERVAGTPYVSQVKEVVATFNRTTREFSYRAVAQTAFGETPVVIAPGDSANLGDS
jgi:hypothetical protein